MSSFMLGLIGGAAKGLGEELAARRKEQLMLKLKDDDRKYQEQLEQSKLNAQQNKWRADQEQANRNLTASVFQGMLKDGNYPAAVQPAIYEALARVTSGENVDLAREMKAINDKSARPVYKPEGAMEQEYEQGYSDEEARQQEEYARAMQQADRFTPLLAALSSLPPALGMQLPALIGAQRMEEGRSEAPFTSEEQRAYRQQFNQQYNPIARVNIGPFNEEELAQQKAQETGLVEGARLSAQTAANFGLTGNDEVTNRYMTLARAEEELNGPISDTRRAQLYKQALDEAAVIRNQPKPDTSGLTPQQKGEQAMWRSAAPLVNPLSGASMGRITPSGEVMTPEGKRVPWTILRETMPLMPASGEMPHAGMRVAAVNNIKGTSMVLDGLYRAQELLAQLEKEGVLSSAPALGNIAGWGQRYNLLKAKWLNSKEPRDERKKALLLEFDRTISQINQLHVRGLTGAQAAMSELAKLEGLQTKTYDADLKASLAASIATAERTIANSGWIYQPPEVRNERIRQANIRLGRGSTPVNTEAFNPAIIGALADEATERGDALAAVQADAQSGNSYAHTGGGGAAAAASVFNED